MRNLLLAFLLLSISLTAQKVEKIMSNTFPLDKLEDVEVEKVYENGFLYQLRCGKKSGKIVKINQESEIVASSIVFPELKKGGSAYNAIYEAIFYKDKIVFFGSKKVKNKIDIYRGVLDLESLKLVGDFEKVVTINSFRSMYKPSFVFNSKMIAIICRNGKSSVIPNKIEEHFILFNSSGDLVKEESYTSVKIVGGPRGDYILSKEGVAFELITDYVGAKKPREFFIKKVGATEDVQKLTTPVGAYKLQWQTDENGEKPFIVGLSGSAGNWPIPNPTEEWRINAESVLLGVFDPKDFKSTKIKTKDVPQFGKGGTKMNIRKTHYLKNGGIIMMFHYDDAIDARGTIIVVCTDSELKTKWVKKGPLFTASFPAGVGLVTFLSFEKEDVIQFLYHRPKPVKVMGVQYYSKIYPPENNMELVAAEMTLVNGEYTEKSILTYGKWKECIRPGEGWELSKGVYVFKPNKAKDHNLLKITFN